MPISMKNAVLSPLLKKPSLDFEIFSNFRPVSNLKFLSKVIEKVAAMRLTNYLCDNDLNESLQSAYKKHHSCETALLRVQNDILKSIDDKQCVVLLLLDLSAAFDTVDHKILLHRLRSRFGIKGKALSWLQSYLTDRSQSVQIDGFTSSVRPLRFGVPQGSVLGPLLYLLYTAPLGDLIRWHDMDFHLYADDTQLYTTFSCDDKDDLTTTISRIESCLVDITNWMTTNKLKLNTDKTELLILYSRFRLPPRLPSIKIGTDIIKPTNKARNIGVIFDNTVTTRLMNKARREFYSNFIDENSGDQKKLFRASQRLFKHTMDDGLPPNLDSKTFSNDLGKFFVQKIDTIRTQLDTDQQTDSYPEDDTSSADETVPPFPTFTMLSVRDVKQLIQNSALKSCPLDPMPSTLVSKCEDLLPVLTKIVNNSLQSGCFPEIWKEALVFPLLKKPGLDVIFKNFRPVSNLSFVSKLIERAAFNQIHGHLVRNNLYPVAQSAYRRNQSTETALLKVMNDILLNMNKQHVTILVLLDLSAAFDTVDHSILLNRLSSKLGLNGTALAWFRSYLSGRSQ